MKWTFRRTLLLCFFTLVLILGAGTAYLGAALIQKRIYAEAQDRVRSNLLVARAVYDSRLDRVLSTVRICAELAVTRSALAGRDVDRARADLARIRIENNLDFLTLTNEEGLVRLRTAPPFGKGDSRAADELMIKTLKGEVLAGTHILTRSRLEQEAENLAERAYTVFDDTPRARPRPDKVETSGMVLIAACPIHNTRGDLIGAVYGGELLNRNDHMVDEIRDAAFGKDSAYNGKPLGNVTLFHDDVRIATNVLKTGGNRAIGSRVSKEVYDAVVENGRTWSDRAFVVNDWYLAAYAPIRDVIDRETIGMFYMGILAERYDDERTAQLGRFLLVILLAIAAALVISFLLAYRLSAPIDRLVAAAGEVSSGKLGATVVEKTAFSEVAELTRAFNRMSEDVKMHSDDLHEANEALQIANRNYMEMLGFVTHELKSPLASVAMNLDTLRKERVGPLNEQQAKVVDSLIRNARYFDEMIKNYLDLSRIEKGELAIQKSEIDLRSDVIDPMVESLHDQFESKRMSVTVDVPKGVKLQADPNLLKIVYDNLLSNAAKYGREGGDVTLGFEESFGRFRLNVKNAGKGIKPEEMDSLFRKFSRLTEEAHAKQKGTGLGLFISREIVEKHGGKIWAESEPEQWANFMFEIPKGAE